MMTQTVTSDSEPQRLRALGRANEVRLARAELKRRIAGGSITAAEVILVCPQEASSWSMRELLMSQRRWGSKRCRTFLERNHIGELKPIGDLTERQKQMLAAQLAIAGESLRLAAEPLHIAAEPLQLAEQPLQLV